MFRWAYLPGKKENLDVDADADVDADVDVDVDDPLLAPLKADRRTVCEKVYVLGCECDLLCTEAEEAAEAYAEADRMMGRSGPRVELRGGGRVGWREGNVTWEKLMGMEHGFNQRLVVVRGEEKKLWQRRMVEMHKNVAEWLFREVYV